MKRLLVTLTFFVITISATECLAYYVSFTWRGGPPTANPGYAYRSDGSTPLPAGSTMLIYVSTTDSTANWSDQWSDGNDGGDYGARNDDQYLGSMSCGSAGGYNTGVFLENPAIHNGDYVYFVVVDTPYATFDDTYTLANGADYDLMDTTFQVNQFDTPSGQYQTFAPGVTLITNNDITIVPEPTTLALLATGMGVLAMRRRKKQAGETEQSA